MGPLPIYSVLSALNILLYILICLYNTKKPSMPSSTAAPDSTALLSINATTAAKNILSTAPAATATARNASITKAANGWKHNLTDDYPATTSCSLLPCLNKCGPSAALIKRLPMAQCSRLPQTLSKNRLKTLASLAPICRVLPPCSIPGDDRCSITPICTASSRLADCPPIEISGCPPATPSICRSKPSPKSSEPNSRPK